MTEWIWPNQDTTNLNNWTWPKLKPVQASLQAGAGGPFQADRTSIYFCHQGNVHGCEKILVMFNHDFWSSSFSQVN